MALQYQNTRVMICSRVIILVALVLHITFAVPITSGGAVKYSSRTKNKATLREKCRDNSVSTVLEISDECARGILELSKRNHKGLNGSDVMQVCCFFVLLNSRTNVSF